MLRRIAAVMLLLGKPLLGFAASPVPAPQGVAASPSAAASNTAAPTWVEKTAPEIADLARALLSPLPAPLKEKRGLIELPRDYPADRARALDRLNCYRLAAGLSPYVYDPVLSEMGQAHADYILAKAGTETGHFELSGDKGYTKGGDEAARTSGLSYGDADPLEALEGLMSGTFHRLQFLRPNEIRVGLGHSYRSPDAGGTLFVTREAEGSAPQEEPRFVLFPPDGFDDALNTFSSGEKPDPRPGMGPDSPDTGLPITICLLREDVEKFEGAKVAVKDEKGAELPIWLSYPGRPAVDDPDLSIYADDHEFMTKAYRDNFDAVFILPKAPLVKGATYSVKAELRIDGRTETLAWSFKTRGPTLWTLRPDPANRRDSLESALQNATEGDTILLAAGEYEIGEPVIIDTAIRVVGEPGRTVLRYSGSEDMSALLIDSRVVFRGLDIKGEFPFYLNPGSGLLLKGCRFFHTDEQAALSCMERGSSLVLESCDFSAFRCAYLTCFLEIPAASPLPTLYLGAGNAFGPLDYRGKRSFGPGNEKNLSRLLE